MIVTYPKNIGTGPSLWWVLSWVMTPWMVVYCMPSWEFIRPFSHHSREDREDHQTCLGLPRWLLPSQWASWDMKTCWEIPNSKEFQLSTRNMSNPHVENSYMYPNPTSREQLTKLGVRSEESQKVLVECIVTHFHTCLPTSPCLSIVRQTRYSAAGRRDGVSEYVGLCIFFKNVFLRHEVFALTGWAPVPWPGSLGESGSWVADAEVAVGKSRTTHRLELVVCRPLLLAQWPCKLMST